MYGRMGNHPSLDNFKQSNGFTQFQLTRYFVPITRKGRIAIKLGLHRDMKDLLPQSVKRALIPIYNWTSRNRSKVKSKLKATATSRRALDLMKENAPKTTVVPVPEFYTSLEEW
jgi:hypothetical protein